MKKVMLLVALSLLLAGCGQSPANSTLPPAPAPTATPTATPARTVGPPAPTPTPIPTKPLSLDEQIRSVTLTAVQQVTQGAHATVEVYDGEVDETEMLADCCARDDDIHIECFKLMHAIWHDSMARDIKNVDVRLTATLVNKYGQTSIGDVGQCVLSRGTEQKFVWENLTQDSAWDAYDSTWILPEA
jgi:hypothetical protein